MLTLLSPAKNLDLEPVSRGVEFTNPRLSAQTKTLAEAAKQQSADDLKNLMHISDNLAELNVQRFQDFALTGRRNSDKPAALMFNGDVYRGLDANSLSDDDLDFAQDHLRILSGLYGALRPLDRIQPYRLEMGTKFSVGGAKNLYAFWGNDIARSLAHDLDGHYEHVIVNLASNEYVKAVPKKALSAPMIDVSFKEDKDGKSRVISFYAKYARGLMARWIIQNRVDRADDLKDFNVDGYRFNAAESNEKALLFSRPQPAPKS